MSATQLDLRRRPTPGSRRWISSEIANSVLCSASPVLGLVIQAHPPASFSWARQDIRNLVNIARVLVYDHGDMSGDRGLKTLASDLLRVVDAETRGSRERPIFFLCHSVGGLVVKVALTQASRSSTHQPLFRRCHGVGFFATPHRGSKFLASEDYKPSIERLLRLANPLPSVLIRELMPESPALLKVDENFKELVSEMRVWSLYEAADSRLLERRVSGAKEVQLTTVIASMRSMTEMHTHARGEVRGINLHASLKLEQQGGLVKIHGFYEPDSPLTVEAGSSLRVFVTKRSLSNFYDTAPKQLLQERLDVEDKDSEILNRATSLIPPSSAAPRFLEHVPEDERRFELSSAANQPRSQLSLTRPKEVLSPTVEDGDIDNSDFEASDPVAIRGGGVPSKTSVQRDLKGEMDPNTDFPSDEVSQGSSSPVMRESSVSAPNSPTQSPVLRFVRFSGESWTRKEGPVHRNSTGTARDPRPSSVAYPQLLRRRLLSVSGVAAPPPLLSIQDYDLREESTAATDHSATPSFHPQPSKETPKFVWIHVSANNPSWVRKVFEALSVHQRRDFSEVLNEENWKSRHARGRHSQHHACFLKTTCAFTSLKFKFPPNGPGSAKTAPQYRERSTSAGSIQQIPAPDCLYLYFPFLHFDSYKMLIRRRDMIRRRMRQGRTCPVPRDVQENSSIELRMIWEFLGHDPPVNCRRTLDQYRYPSLRDTRARDDDQMLYKMTKQSVYRAVERRNTSFSLKNGINWIGRQLTHHFEGDSEDGGDGADSDDTCSEIDSGEPGLDDGKAMQDVLDGNVLMVDQLWLWAIDSSENSLLLSCLFFGAAHGLESN